MFRSVVAIACVALAIQSAEAKESSAGLNIKSPKDALALISQDSFGSISLQNLFKDITGNVVYRERTNYSTGYVEVVSQNTVGHFGSVDFSFKPPYDFGQQDVLALATRIPGAKVSNENSTVNVSWSSNQFKCMVAFHMSGQASFFEYLCDYIGE
jgi:hypothetical protein